jgi:hypothetical protein
VVICFLVPAMDRPSTAVAATQQDYDDCSQMSDPARTIAACTRVIADQTQSAADRAGAYLQRGNAHMAGASLDEAIADYGAAIQLDPKNILAYAARAIAFSRKGDREHAIADYRQAGEIDPAKLAEMAAANGELKELGVLAAAQSPPVSAQPSPQPPSAVSSSPEPVQPAAPPAAHEPVQATIRARGSWQETGMVVVQGAAALEFRAAGTWVFNPGLAAVGGDGNCRFSTRKRTMYAYSGPGGCEGQLIGRIGDGRPFVVGAHGSHSVAAGESGQVYLVINDDLEGLAGKGLTDNSGSLTVTIQQR